MIINETEQLWEWMLEVIEPVCQADPKVMVQYVFALLRNDKTMEEHRSTAIHELEVFLGDATESIVQGLFEKIEADQTSKKVKTEIKQGRQSHSPPPTRENKESKPHSQPRKQEQGNTQGHTQGHQQGGEHTDRKQSGQSAQDEEYDPEEGTYRGGSKERSPKISYKRGYEEATRKSQGANDSSEEGAIHRKRNRGDKDSNNINSAPQRTIVPTRSGNISHNNHSGRNLNRNSNSNNTIISTNTHNGSAFSPSPSSLQTDNHAWRYGPQGQGGDIPPNHNMNNMNGPMGARGNSGGPIGGWQQGGVWGRTGSNRQRCPDYENKGFCVLGDECPYQHINPQIVSTDEFNPMIQPPMSMGGTPNSHNPNDMRMGMGMNYAGGGGGGMPNNSNNNNRPPYISNGNMGGGGPIGSFNPPNQFPMGMNMNMNGPQHPMQTPPQHGGRGRYQTNQFDYNQNQNGDMRLSLGSNARGGHNNVKDLRELLNRQRMNNNSNTHIISKSPTPNPTSSHNDVEEYQPEDPAVTVSRVPVPRHSDARSVDVGEEREGGPISNPNFIYSKQGASGPNVKVQAGGRGGPMGFKGPKGTVVEISGLPIEHNNVPALSEYFCRYGMITNIQLEYGGVSHIARIHFSNPQEAYAAIHDPNAVFGNRFIKLYVPRDDHSYPHPNRRKNPSFSGGKAGSIATEPQPQKEGADKTGEGKGKGGGELDEWQKQYIDQFKHQQEEMIRQKTEQKKAMLDHMKKAAAQKEKLINEQKAVIERLTKEKATLSKEEKAELMAKLKSFTITPSAPTTFPPLPVTPAAPPINKSYEERRRRALDVQLDAMQSEGNRNKPEGISTNEGAGGTGVPNNNQKSEQKKAVLENMKKAALQKEKLINDQK
eukprot:Ihof_evm4s182 gene=Ihof_evmTU4s182